jgi:hypothetical protein
MGVPVPREPEISSELHRPHDAIPLASVVPEEHSGMVSTAIDAQIVSPYLLDQEIVSNQIVYMVPPDLTQHAELMEVDPESLQVLPGVSICSGVTIMDYGSDRHLSGRLLGHHRTIAYSEPAPDTFKHRDLVYIEDFFGTRYLGYLLGPVWADPARLAHFDAEGMPHEDPGCPHHGRLCVMGQYFSAVNQWR